MDRDRLERLLRRVAAGELAPAAAAEEIATLPLAAGRELLLDTHRQLRTGFPEAIFAAGKTPDQVAEAFARLAEAHDRVLATRAGEEHAAAVTAAVPGAEFDPVARTLSWRAAPPGPARGRVAVVAAGTSDLPAAAEAARTLELMDVAVERHEDVGVAGLHRLLGRLEQLRRAEVLIVCAGMEGALPSVVGGLVRTPVVAVPTGIGYGASFGGLAALLAMLNSCAPGVAVVNIDNGFGAAMVAGRIVQAVGGQDPGAIP
ncbi:MAG: nickel pincer cofactor biosynthesis protein LarB [Planctomycetota bacterium]|nr:MAG: nickel pincer cofactor biosynthesis protein LarB [Planctomycetota bacterium]